MLSHKGFEQGLAMKKRRIEVKRGADVREITLQIALRSQRSQRYFRYLLPLLGATGKESKTV